MKSYADLNSEQNAYVSPYVGHQEFENVNPPNVNQNQKVKNLMPKNDHPRPGPSGISKNKSQTNSLQKTDDKNVLNNIALNFAKDREIAIENGRIKDAMKVEPALTEEEKKERR